MMSSRNSPSFSKQFDSNGDIFLSFEPQKSDSENENQGNYDQHSFRNLNPSRQMEDKDFKQQMGGLINFYRESNDKENYCQSTSPQVKSRQSTKKEAFKANFNSSEKISNKKQAQSVNIDMVPKSCLDKTSFTKLLTVFHTNQIKHMIKPDKSLCIGVQALIAFFLGCDSWLPSIYDFQKKNFAWIELQSFICHPQFHNLLTQSPQLINNGKIPDQNYHNCLVLFEMSYKASLDQILSTTSMSQIQQALVLCTQGLLKYYEEYKSFQGDELVQTPKQKVNKKRNTKPEDIIVSFEIDLESQIPSNNPSSLSNNDSNQIYNSTTNEGAFFGQDKLSPIIRNNNDKTSDHQIQQNYQNDFSFDSIKIKNLLGDTVKPLIQNENSINRSNMFNHMLNISEKRQVSFEKKRASRENIFPKKRTISVNISSTPNDITHNTTRTRSQEQNINLPQKRVSKILQKPIGIVKKNILTVRCVTEQSDRHGSQITSSKSQSKKQFSNSTNKNTSSQRIRTESSKDSKTQTKKLDQSGLFSFKSNNQNEPMSKRQPLFQAKALDQDSKSQKNPAVKEKKELYLVIEQHKKIINRLQDQESRIKWKIEREAKQLSKLQQDHTIKKEMSWNRQQRLHSDSMQVLKDNSQKRERQCNYKFRQELRDNSQSLERNVKYFQHKKVIQDTSFKSLQYIARKSQDDMRICVERLQIVQNKIIKNQNSSSPNFKKFPSSANY